MTDLADREWRLIREEARDGPMNMALDEIAAETAARGGPRTLRVYQWKPSTLSLGYNQDADTVDWDYCDREGITVTRRPTGGGGIYHDTHGDVSYSIVAPAAELPGDLMDCYELLCTPIMDAFADVGVPVTFADEKRPAVYQPACYLRKLHPAHDVVSATDGRKLSGNAQYRRRDSVIQHGSLTYAGRADRHLAVFSGHDVPVDEFEERVGAIEDYTDRSRTEAVESLTDALAAWADADDGEWTEAELASARDRAEKKYAADSWTRDREDPT
ncbi:lipoate--protein ligase family protein [Halorientalis pallida]|uniref:Lipoate--protein ligase family protein n=1 Tax=Halorientalis pallida TaxID=2479928 RepID=A0A498KXR8_9EURY|nr:biotin/lipoate A/B protein ligase family protein [Halorientalis pallida]RXK46915.1 lipoate--protein ligase family protein [Halorientalis pallida]